MTAAHCGCYAPPVIACLAELHSYAWTSTERRREGPCFGKLLRIPTLSTLLPALHETHLAGFTFANIICCWPLQALRRMAMFGYQPDARTLQQVAAVGRLTPALLQTLQTLVAARPPLAAWAATAAGGGGGATPRSQLAAMVDRGMLKLLKSLRQIQEMHPW